MSERLTKTAARNIFFGGTIFFLVVFIGLTAHSVVYINSTSSNPQDITPGVVLGKEVWERHSCINCHTLMGEGAYFAPELVNVWVRYGGREDAEAAREGIKAWIRSQPTGIHGRRQMPAFNMTEADLEGLVDFFEWVSRVKTQNWPPNEAG